MALGNVDINTMERIDDFNPDAPVTQVKFITSHSIITSNILFVIVPFFNFSIPSNE